MYPIISRRSTSAPTLISFLNLVAFFSVFSAHFYPTSGRHVHNHLLYPAFDHAYPKLDRSSLDEWAGVQGLWESIQSELKATPSRQQIAPKISGLPTHSVSSPSTIPTKAPLLNHYARLNRRDTFSSNVCPIDIQTTIYISVDGTTTQTLFTTSGPRPTGIPGDTGTSTGTDPTGGRSGTGTSGGQSFGDKEGLITGLVIVLLILLASFCALGAYFYKKRRNARIQRLSAQPHTDAADIVRRMGSRGFLGISNSDRDGPGSRRWPSPIQWSPLAFFRRSIDRLKSSRRDRERDSQSSELLEWKQRMGQTNVGTGTWSVAENSVAEPSRSEKNLRAQPPNNRTSGASIPEVISSPALSSIRIPPSPKAGARVSTGESSPGGFTPLVNRRVSPHHRPADRLSAVRPISGGPTNAQMPSPLDLHRETSPRRNSRGEPLSPAAWMAGFGLASGSNVDPFTNPAYGSVSDRHDSVGTHSPTKLSEPGSPLSNTPSSSASDQTARGRQISPRRIINPDRLDAVIEPSRISGDGASDIISTFGSAFGDRPASHHTTESVDDLGQYTSNQLARFHALSDVEEVLTPVADERLSIQPGSAFFTWRHPQEERTNSSGSGSGDETPGQSTQFVNPFADDVVSSLPPPPPIRNRKPPTPRRKSEANSLAGAIQPSEESGSYSMTGTSIVDPGPPIDAGDWDDALARRREEDSLFYTRPDTGTSSVSNLAR